MKLKTELYPNRIKGMSFGYDDDSLRHDSYAAHALMQAITEFKTSSSESFEDLVADQIESRAEEILAEWGYTED